MKHSVSLDRSLTAIRPQQNIKSAGTQDSLRASVQRQAAGSTRTGQVSVPSCVISYCEMFLMSRGRPQCHSSWMRRQAGAHFSLEKDLRGEEE